MGNDFYKFLADFLSNVEAYKFIIYILSIVLLISLPTILSLIKESAVHKKIKKYHELTTNAIERSTEKISMRMVDELAPLYHSINKANEKIDVMNNKNTNIIDDESVIYFIGPIYKNISLSVYKEIDLLLYDYDLKHSKKELQLIIKRDVSVKFKKAYLLLNKYSLVNGHQLSFYVNEKWEHWVYKAIDELLFESNIDQLNIRIHLWNLLETSLDECIDEIDRKIKT